MIKKFVSRSLLVALLVSAPGTALFAQNNDAKERKSRMEQLKSYYNAFDRNVRSYIRCIASGECESERQKAIVAEIGSLVKKITTAIIALGFVYGTTKIVRSQIEKPIQDLSQKTDLLLQQAQQVQSNVKQVVPALQEKSIELDVLGYPVASVEVRSKKNASISPEKAQFLRWYPNFIKWHPNLNIDDVTLTQMMEMHKQDVLRWSKRTGEPFHFQKDPEPLPIEFPTAKNVQFDFENETTSSMLKKALPVRAQEAVDTAEALYEYTKPIGQSYIQDAANYARSWKDWYKESRRQARAEQEAKKAEQEYQRELQKGYGTSE